MADLTRSQFCELTRLSPDALKSLSRRWQLPFEIDQKTSGRGYTYFEAFLTIVSKEFETELIANTTRAGCIAASLPPVLAPEWARIVETARKIADLTGEKVVEIMCGRAYPGHLEFPSPVCGTYSEIAQQLENSDTPFSRLIVCSASRCLARLIIRADDLNLNIPDTFWSPPFAFRERPSSYLSMMASMKKLIAEEALQKESEG